MVSEKHRLESVGRYLIEAFERRRPGVTAWTPELERELLVESETAIREMEGQCRELGIDDPKYWLQVRAAVKSILLPRYAALAQEELALAKAGYHLWRGGDLLARGAFALAGLVLGAIAVEIPWIPVYEKWIPWALFVAGPLLPDAQLWYYRLRHQRRLRRLIDDLARAGRSFETYRPLSELQQVMGDSSTERAREPAAREQPPLEGPFDEESSSSARSSAETRKLKH